MKLKTLGTVKEYLTGLIGTSAKEWGGGSGTQCVELPKYFIEQYYGCTCKDLGLGNGNTLYSGIASQFSSQFKAIDYYDGIQLQVGDIVSYHSASSPEYGHAGVVYEVNGSTYKIIEQWKGSSTVRTNTLTVTGPIYGQNHTIIGIARHK